MKKIVFLVLALVLTWSFCAQALETTLIDSRSEILKNSQEMKKYFSSSRDPILLTSMWDSAIMAVSQLDAYFSMLGIFNTIKNEDLQEPAFTYLVKWLGELAGTTELNIKSLEAINTTTDARSKVFVSKLKKTYNDLKILITKEMQTVAQLQEALKK